MSQFRIAAVPCSPTTSPFEPGVAYDEELRQAIEQLESIPDRCGVLDVVKALFEARLELPHKHALAEMLAGTGARP